MGTGDPSPRPRSSTWALVNPGLGVGLGLVAILAVTYGFELFNYHLTIDDELTLYLDQPGIWVAQDRWVMHLITRLLLPYPFVPVVPLAVGLVTLTAGAIVIARTWGVAEGRALLLVTGLIVTTPTLAFPLAFSSLAPGIGIGFLCVAGSLVAFTRGGVAGLIIAALFAALPLGIHQSFALVLLAAYVVLLTTEPLATASKRWRRVGEAALVGVAAATAHLGAATVTRWITGIPKGTYVDFFLQPGALVDQPRLVIGRIARTLWNAYRGDSSLFGVWVIALPVLVIVAVGVVIATAVRRGPRPFADRIWLAGGAVAVLGVPFVGGLITRGVIAPRFLIALPIALGGLVAVALRHENHGLRGMLTLVTGLCILQFAVSTNALALASHLTVEEDFATANAIITRVEAAALDVPNSGLIEIIGSRPRASLDAAPTVGTIGRSIFEQDSGSRGRIQALLTILGLDGYTLIPSYKRGPLVALAQAMPSFPAEGSVVVSNGVLLVKLSDYTAAQITAICATSTSTPDGFCP